MALATDELIRKATTTTTQLDALIPEIWAAQIEKNLRKSAVFQQFVVENTDLLVPGAGDTVDIPSLPDLGAAAALTEGTDMTLTQLSSATSVQLSPSEVGAAVEVTRKALDRIKYDGMAEVIDRLTYAMSLKIEGDLAALYDADVPGTSNKINATVYSGGKTSSNIAAGDVFTDAMVFQGVQLLMEDNNVPFPDGFFRLIISPAQYATLMQDADVRQDLRFGAPTALFNGEMGALHKCRIIVSNYVPTTTENSVTVHKAMLLAPRWAAIAWKRRPGVVVDPTLYDMGRRRRFGVFADYQAAVIHNDRAQVLTSTAS